MSFMPPSTGGRAPTTPMDDGQRKRAALGPAVEWFGMYNDGEGVGRGGQMVVDNRAKNTGAAGWGNALSQERKRWDAKYIPASGGGGSYLLDSGGSADSRVAAAASPPPGIEWATAWPSEEQTSRMRAEKSFMPAGYKAPIPGPPMRPRPAAALAEMPVNRPRLQQGGYGMDPEGYWGASMQASRVQQRANGQ